jgi:hypothetical protein
MAVPETGSNDGCGGLVKTDNLLHTFTIEWNRQTFQDIWFPVAANMILIYSVQMRL